MDGMKSLLRVRKRWPGRLVVTGTSTFARYEFSDAQPEMYVSSADLPAFVGVGRQLGCCGGESKFEPYFEVIGSNSTFHMDTTVGADGRRVVEIRPYVKRTPKLASETSVSVESKVAEAEAPQAADASANRT